MAERPAQEGEGPSLVGLAKAWEKDDVIRQSALKNGQLLKWPDKKRVGVISFETIAFNARVLDLLLRFHCPSLKTPKTVNIDLLRDEVRGTKVKTSGFFKLNWI